MKTGNLLLLSAMLCSLLVAGMSVATGPRGKHRRQLHNHATSVPPNSLLKQTGIMSCPHFHELRSHLALKHHPPGTKCHHIKTKTVI